MVKDVIAVLVRAQPPVILEDAADLQQVGLQSRIAHHLQQVFRAARYFVFAAFFHHLGTVGCDFDLRFTGIVPLDLLQGRGIE